MTTTSGTTVELPPMYTPFPSGVNPAVDVLTEEGLAWMRSLGLRAGDWEGKVVRTASGLFCSRVSPRAPAELLRLQVDLTYLGFLLDDLWQETDNRLPTVQDGNAHSAAFMHALRTGDGSIADAAPFGPAAADLGRRIRRNATEAQVRGLLDAMDSCNLAVAWQVAYSHRKTTPDLNTLLAYRTVCCGGALVSPWFSMYLDTARRDVVTAGTFNAMSMYAFIRATWAVAAFDNDIVSYGKEERGNRRHGGSVAPHNIVGAIAAIDDVDLATAMRRAAVMRNALVLRVVELRERVLAETTDPVEAVERYLDNYCTMISGNLDWSLECDRYRDPEHPEGPITFVRQVMTDPPRTAGPLPYPAVRWLWSEPGSQAVEHGGQ
ncbi:hypothetical protein ABTX81_01350 [Kitasatospora sp. NPDC097605]|uniref:terpene synthase family protein n=1 Tax=Kitasatospora sp. NPDC097605 TaxID=3157226 RepID=UPI00332ADDCB